MLNRWATVVLSALAICLLIAVAPAVAAEYSVATPVRSTPYHGWLTLETPHFMIHFPPGEEQIARQLAVAAEEAHRFVIPRLEYLPAEKTHVVLADTTDIANASTSVVPYNLIIVNPASLGAGSFLDGIVPMSSLSWLQTVLYHEYTHVVHLDLHDDITAYIRQIFGRIPGAASPNAYLGPAITEGYAVYLETLSGQGRGNSPIYQMYLQAAVSGGDIPLWDRVLGDYPTIDFEPGPPYYLFGYSLINYIARMYGEEKLALALHRYTERPLDGINAAFSYALDQSFAQIWQGWWQDLQIDFQLDDVGSGNIQLMQQVGQVALWPSWSPDGSHIAYSSSGGVVSALRLQSPNSDRKLVNGLINSSGRISWHPSGQQLVYGRLEYDNQNRLFSDIYSYDIAKGIETRLSNGYRAHSPTFSPDGRYIAYISRQGQESRVLIQTYPKGEPRILLSPADIDGMRLETIVSLAWSPAGDGLAFTAALHGGGMGLFILPITRFGNMWLAGKLQMLASGEELYMDPAWSPDGCLLFFSSNRLGPIAIHAIDIHKGALYQVSRALYGAFCPVVSPDGTTLLLTAYDDTGYHLASLPINSTTWQQWPEKGDEQVVTSQPGEIFSMEVIRLTPLEKAEAAQMPAALLGSTRKAGRTPAAWERDLMQEVDPSDYTIKPYDEWQSMTPRFWAPIWGGPDGNWLTGVSTSNSDALGRHSYHLDLTLTRAGAACQLQYKWYPIPLSKRWEWAIGIIGSRQLNELKLEGKVHLSWLHRQVMKDRLVTISAITSRNSSNQNETIIGLDAKWSSVDGDGRLQVQANTDCGLQQKLESILNLSGYLRWQKTWCIPDNWQVQMSTVVKASTQSEYYVAGRAPGMVVRGLGQRQLQGRLATQATIQLEKVLFTVNRGWDDKPLFLHNIALDFFADAGAAGNSIEQAPRAVSAGLEAVTRGSIAYGLVDVSFRAGMARLLDGSQPYRFYVNTNLKY